MTKTELTLSIFIGGVLGVTLAAIVLVFVLPYFIIYF